MKAELPYFLMEKFLPPPPLVFTPFFSIGSCEKKGENQKFQGQQSYWGKKRGVKTSGGGKKLFHQQNMEVQLSFAQ